MKHRFIKIGYLVLLIFSIASCNLSDRDLLAPEKIEIEIPSVITKWKDDHKAAISLTYDHGRPLDPNYFRAQELIIKYNLHLDYDLVTRYDLYDTVLINYIHSFMIPNGFGFFGHGHDHSDHDDFTYWQSLESFTTCYNSMKEMGIKPVAYAYPGGFSSKFSTRRALKNSGFLSGRKFEQLDFSNPFILSYEETEPKDWFALPSLIMQSLDYIGSLICVNNAKELAGYLDEAIKRTAWIITTYHHIGDRTQYGFYDYDEFERDLIEIKKRDVWCAHLSDVTLYARERKNASAKVLYHKDENEIPQKISIELADGLPNEIYDYPLTIKFKLPAEWVAVRLNLYLGEEKIKPLFFESDTVLINIIPDEKEYIISPETL